MAIPELVSNKKNKASHTLNRKKALFNIVSDNNCEYEQLVKTWHPKANNCNSKILKCYCFKLIGNYVVGRDEQFTNSRTECQSRKLKNV